MGQGSVRINITLPEDLVRSLDNVAGLRNRSRFIREAVEMKIELRRKSEMEALLAEGYKARREEAKGISEEFEASDLEGWVDD